MKAREFREMSIDELQSKEAELNSLKFFITRIDLTSNLKYLISSSGVKFAYPFKTNLFLFYIAEMFIIKLALPVRCFVFKFFEFFFHLIADNVNHFMFFKHSSIVRLDGGNFIYL